MEDSGLKERVLTPDREHYVTDNLNLVHYSINRYIKPSREDYSECFQEGCIGLIKAAIRFEENRGVSFSTFATPYIVGYVRKSQRESSSLLHHSRTIYDMAYKVQRYQEEHSDASSYDIIEHLNISPSMFLEISHMRDVRSLDWEIDGKDGNSIRLAELIPDPNFRESDFTMEVILDTVEQVLAKASDTSRKVYGDYFYSHLAEEKLTQKDLARKYGVSQPQVSRIIRGFNAKLKKALKVNGVDV